MKTSFLPSGLATLAVFTAFATATVQAQTITKQWDFTEAASTLLTGTSTTGTVAGTWTASITGVSTNGSGGLAVGSTATATTYSSLGSNSSGIVTMNVFVSSYNFTSSESFGFGFYNAASASGATVERAVFRTDSPTAPTQIQLFTVGANAAGDSAGISNLPLTGSNLVLSLSVNKTANTFSYYYDAGAGANYVASNEPLGNLGMTRNVDFAILRPTGTYTGTSLVIDKITVDVTAVPEPSTYAALAGLSALGLVASRRRRR